MSRQALVQGSSRSFALAALAACAVLAGCSASVGEEVVKKSEVEQQAIAQLAASKGIPLSQAPKLTCPEDLKAKIGATMTCSIGTPPGKVYDVFITVTSVNEDTKKVSFDIKVASTPRQQ